MKTVCIIQAREGSTRFPGKILKKINGKSVLKHMIERINPKPNQIDEIVIATTPTSHNIHDFCKRYNNLRYPHSRLSMYVGSEEDVLQRVYYAALSHGADIIVDLTSDCPLVDKKHIDKLIDMLLKNNKQYASNINPRQMFDGADIQVYSIGVLAYLNNSSKSYRCHTGWNAINDPFIDTSLSIVPQEKHIMPDVRLTLDYPEDLDTIANVINHFGDRYYSYEDICDFILAHPEALTNKHLKSKIPGE